MRLYADLLKYLRTAEEAGVRFVFDAFAEEGRPIKNLADAYELLVVQGLLEQFLSDDGQFVQTIGDATLTRARESFMALDEELYRLEGEGTVGKQLNDAIPCGIGHGPAAGWTEHALIKRELRKQNHMPLRQLFTSLKPADIVLTGTSSKGVRALRGFLGYAAGGAAVDDAVFVADCLRAAGYSVVPQVGVEGFRIDLGVKPQTTRLGPLLESNATAQDTTPGSRSAIATASTGTFWRVSAGASTGCGPPTGSPSRISTPLPPSRMPVPALPSKMSSSSYP